MGSQQVTDTEYDFTQTVNTNQLIDEINTAGLPAADSIETEGTAVQIFYVVPLTAQQQSTLSTVVANHVANPAYVTLALQAQISILIGYINNSSPAIANTARAVIISNIAPNLPAAMLATINSQIAAALG